MINLRSNIIGEPISVIGPFLVHECRLIGEVVTLDQYPVKNGIVEDFPRDEPPRHWELGHGDINL